MMKKMLVGIGGGWVTSTCGGASSDLLKFLLTCLLFLFSFLTLLHFLPSSPFSLFSDSHALTIPPHCLPNSTTADTLILLPDSVVAAASVAHPRDQAPPPLPPPPTSTPSPPPSSVSHLLQKDEVLEGGLIIKRAFNPFGAAAYNFILMSAYRGGLNTFAIMGLASKPLHVYGRPIYQCHWLPHDNNNNRNNIIIIAGTAYKILPDWATATSTPPSSSTAPSPSLSAPGEADYSSTPPPTAVGIATSMSPTKSKS